MKRIYLLLSIVIIASATYSQKSNDILIPEVPYDSLKNFLGKDVAQYIGQELWLKGVTESQREMGYANLVKNFKKAEDINDPKNVYKCCDGYNSKYADLVDKHFMVQSVFRHKINNKNTNKEEYKIFLKLSELSTGDIVYFQYDELTSYSFPFVVVGFLEKQKALLKGQKFVFTSEILMNSKDIKSNKFITFDVKDVWTCTDVDIDKNLYVISVFAKNKAGHVIAVPISVLLSKTLPRNSYTEKESKEILKKFGVYNYKRILERKIAYNMNKEALRYSWGEPMEIRKIGTNEEWIYTAGTVIWKANKIIKIK